MQILSRRLGVTLTGAAAAAALAIPMAGQADAATSTVLLHTNTTIPKLLTENPSALVTMEPAPLGGNLNQRWVKTDTDSGYATYTSVSSIVPGKKPHCLTGRGLQGAPVVTAEFCIPGAAKQQWRLGASGDFQLRLNGLVAGVSANNTGVLMQFFTAKPDQKWHTHPA